MTTRVQVDDHHGSIALYLDDPTGARPYAVDALVATLRAAGLTRAQGIAWLARHTADREAAARVAEESGWLL